MKSYHLHVLILGKEKVGGIAIALYHVIGLNFGFIYGNPAPDLGKVLYLIVTKMLNVILGLIAGNQ